MMKANQENQENQANQANKNKLSSLLSRFQPTYKKTETQQTINYYDLISKKMLYTSVKDYDRMVSLLYKNCGKLPKTFKTIEDYQQSWRTVIEAFSHDQILQGLKAAESKTSTSKIDFQTDIPWMNYIQVDDQLFECQVQLKFDPTKIKQSLKQYLKQSVFLLKNKEQANVSFLCLSEKIIPDASPFLTLNFISKNIFEIERLFSEPHQWYAQSISSLLNLSRSFDATFQLAQNSCIEFIATGRLPTIPPIINPSKIDNRLNEHQNQFIHSALNGTSPVIILHGPPGTGKTATLKQLIVEARKRGDRILITASSNQALSELAMRLKEATDKIILMGVQDKLPAKLKAHFLQNWLQHLKTNGDLLFSLTCNIQEALNNGQADIELLFHQLVVLLGQVIEQLNISHDILKEHGVELDKYKTIFTTTPIETDKIVPWVSKMVAFRLALSKLSQSNVEYALLNQPGTVYLGTPSTLGRVHFEESFKYTVIEEGGLLEQAYVFPLLANQTDILICAGDHKQLLSQPISQRATTYQFNDSILQHLIDIGAPCNFLPTQYRMQKDICDFPSNYFYHGQLITEVTPIEYSYKGLSERPLVFCDMSSPEEALHPGFINREEANLVIRCLLKLREENQEASIGVICFYAAQRDLIIDLFSRTKLKGVELITGDASQGREFDIVILPCTRSTDLGFLLNNNRMNVGLTRAKRTLIVLANAAILGNPKLGEQVALKSLMENIRTRSSFEKKLFYTQREFENLVKITDSKQSSIDLTNPVNSTFEPLDDSSRVWSQEIISLLKHLKHLKQGMTPHQLKPDEISVLQEKLASLTALLAKKKEDLEALQNKMVPQSPYTPAHINQTIDVEKNDNVIEKITGDLNHCKHLNQLRQAAFQEWTTATLSAQSPDLTKNQSILESAAYLTDNLLLSRAAFFRLTFTSFAAEDYWRTIFYIQNISIEQTPYSIVRIDSKTDSNYLNSFYNDAVLDCYTQCLNAINERGEFPYGMVGINWKKWVDKDPNNRYRKAVIAHWCLKNTLNFFDIDNLKLKLDMIEMLHSIYSHFLYANKIQVLYQYMFDIYDSFFYSERCQFSSVKERDEAIRLFGAMVKKMSEKTKSHQNDLLQKMVNDRESSSDQAMFNLFFGLKLQYNMKNVVFDGKKTISTQMENGLFDNIKEEQKTWIESAISKHIQAIELYKQQELPRLDLNAIIFCNLMYLYISENNTSKVHALLQEFNIEGGEACPFGESFYLTWFKLIGAQFLLRSTNPKDKQVGQDLMLELLSASTNPALVEVYLLSEENNANASLKNVEKVHNASTMIVSNQSFLCSKTAPKSNTNVDDEQLKQVEYK